MAVANHHHFCKGNDTTPSPAPSPFMLKSSTTDVDSEYIAICITNTNPINPLFPVNLSRRNVAANISSAGPVRSCRLDILLDVDVALARTGGAGGGGACTADVVVVAAAAAGGCSPA